MSALQDPDVRSYRGLQVTRVRSCGVLAGVGLAAFAGVLRAEGEVEGASLPQGAPGAEAMGDPVLAVVDGEEVRAEHVLPFLYLTKTEWVFAALEQAVRQRLVTREAARLGVTVPAERLALKVTEVMKGQDDEFRLQAGPAADFASFIRERYGTDPDVYRRAVERQVRDEMLMARVVRADSRTGERLVVRILVVDQVDVARGVLDKLEKGANFAALAKQVSVDRSSVRGGLFPPLPADCPHPLLEGARALAPKEIAEISIIERGPTRLYRVLKLEKRLEADLRPYAAQAGEIEAELDARPIDPFEVMEWDRRAREHHEIEVRLGRP